MEVTRIYSALATIPADRSSFLETAVGGLASPHDGVRRSALYLIAQIGTARDTVPVAVLLSDDEVTVAHAAVEALVRIGDRRALAALDTWLASGNHRTRTGYRNDVAKMRDELWDRLENGKRPAAPPIDRARP